MRATWCCMSGCAFALEAGLEPGAAAQLCLLLGDTLVACEMQSSGAGAPLPASALVNHSAAPQPTSSPLPCRLVPDLNPEERRSWLALLLEWDTPGSGRTSFLDMLAALGLAAPDIRRSGPPAAGAAEAEAAELRRRLAQLEAELAAVRAAASATGQVHAAGGALAPGAVVQSQQVRG